MSAHLAKLEADIETYIPDKSFNGYAVIDWEAWRPLWLRNYDAKNIYRNKSMELVKKNHPTWTKDKIEEVAKNQFEAAARYVKTQTKKVKEVKHDFSKAKNASRNVSQRCHELSNSNAKEKKCNH